MPTTFHLRTWTRFFAPPEEVWALKTDPAAIAAEFAPWLAFRMDGDALTRCLASGGEGHIPARFGPLLPLVSWPVALKGGTRPERFTDHSQNALFTRFEHDHLFEPGADGSTRYIDAVTFTPAMLPKFSALILQRVFRHRHAVAAKRIPTDPQVTGVSVLRVLVEEEQEDRAAG
jgi:ligand-binding SRPBCC domain-containing protein